MHVRSERHPLRVARPAVPGASDTAPAATSGATTSVAAPVARAAVPGAASGTIAPVARLAATLAALACLLVLAACAGQPSGQPLSAIHANEPDFVAAEATNDEYCFDCHNRKNVAQAARDYDGQPDVNIHEAPVDHPYLTCVSCHAVDSQPVLGCNQSGCHAYALPPDWT